MMNRLWTWTGLVAAGLLVVSGCGRQKTEDAETAKTGTTAPLTVGFSQVGAESAWRTANSESVRNEATKRGIILRFSDAQQRQENQIRAIRSFIAQGVDVIAFSPVVETGWEPVLREAQAGGIPVVLSDRAVDVTADYLYVACIGADFVEEGRRAARWLVEETGGVAAVAELVGTPGSAPAIDRAKGFREVIADHPGMRIIKSQSGDFTRARGREVMESFLQSPEGPQITALFAHNDDMALGAIQALEEAGRNPGKDILIVSIDGVRGAFEAMVAGKLNCTVECNPLMGPSLFDLIEKVVAGEEVPKRVTVPGGVYTMDQAADVIDQRAY